MALKKRNTRKEQVAHPWKPTTRTSFNGCEKLFKKVNHVFCSISGRSFHFGIGSAFLLVCFFLSSKSSCEYVVGSCFHRLWSVNSISCEQ